MHKEFLSCEMVRDNALKLAHRIQEDGFIPDIIYVSLRGGVYMGNVISEYFKLIPRSRPVFYAAVVARSYDGPGHQNFVAVDGWTYSPEHLRSGDKVLLVDDIFDLGYTINHLAGIIFRQGIPSRDFKIAVHDYKIRPYLPKREPIRPDYYCRRIMLNSAEERVWVHYLSHEFVGLTQQEIETYYSDPEVIEIVKKTIPKTN